MFLKKQSGRTILSYVLTMVMIVGMTTGFVPGTSKKVQAKPPTSSDVGETIGHATIGLGEETTLTSFTVTWENYDGTVLETDENVEAGVTPTYDGATPKKDVNDDNIYRMVTGNFCRNS